MKITYLVLGPFMTNTYIIYDENTMDAVIIDPSFTPENIIRAVAQLKVNVKGIFLTHGHVDHMAGLNKLKGVYKEARVYMNINDKEYLSDPKKNLSDSFPQPTICKAADYWVSYREHIKVENLILPCWIHRDILPEEFLFTWKRKRLFLPEIPFFENLLDVRTLPVEI